MMHDVLVFLSGAAFVTIIPSLFRKRRPAATMDEEGNWCFPVDTFAQMLDIPVERRERFLAELPNIFRRIWEMRDRFPLGSLPGTVWVDDGLGELRPNVVNAPENAGDAFASRPIDGEPS